MIRRVIAYKTYFADFFKAQDEKGSGKNWIRFGYGSIRKTSAEKIFKIS